MLNYFEKVWKANIGADDAEISEIENWMKEQAFPRSVLPSALITLLRKSNGGDFTVGQREYQLFSTAEICKTYETYQFDLYMPFALPWAMDGCGNFYVFNLRGEDAAVYAVSAGNMGWAPDECFRIANNFEECLTQTIPLDDLMR